jgi:hypothetical protein
MRSSSVRPGLVSFILAFLLAGQGLLAAERIEVVTKAVPLNPQDPAQRKVGRLTFRGGLSLASRDSRFGGFSSLRLGDGGARITLVSDQGSWLTAGLVHDDRGDLVGLEAPELGPLLGLDGKPLADKEAADAESLALLPDGSMIVGFEHQHRLWRYPATSGRPDGTPSVVPPPVDLPEAPDNGGIEALVAWDEGGLVALTEYWIVNERVRGFLRGPDGWRPLDYLFAGAYRPSDMARLPSGDLAVLERAYNPQRGIVGIRLRRVKKRQVKGKGVLTSELIAELDPPLTVDNFEGVDAVRGKGKETLVYLVSDNNFRSEGQRTLLLMFSLDGK